MRGSFSWIEQGPAAATSKQTGSKLGRCSRSDMLASSAGRPRTCKRTCIVHLMQPTQNRPNREFCTSTFAGKGLHIRCYGVFLTYFLSEMQFLCSRRFALFDRVPFSDGFRILQSFLMDGQFNLQNVHPLHQAPDPHLCSLPADDAPQ